MPRLWDELVDSIIEEVYDNSQASIYTLRNCALVSRAWAHASQRRIFRTILFRSSVDDASRLDLLITLFDANPRLPTYVKHLELKRYGSIEYSDNVTGVINRLSNLDEIKLFGFDWAMISPGLEESLLGILRCPSLTKVTFYVFKFNCFSDFAALLSNLTHLKSLEINNVGCNDWSLPVSGENSVITYPLSLPRSIQLIELDLHGVHEQILAWFQQGSCPFDYQKLRTLRLSDDSGWTMLNYERLASIIRCAAKSLRELELGGPNADLQNIDDIHLGYIPDLRSLTLPYSEHTASAPWIENLFRSVVNSKQQSHPLQSFTIDLSYWWNDSVAYHPDPFQNQGWTALDNIFKEKVFAALEEITFRYRRSFWEGEKNKEKEKKEKMGKLLHKALPFLAGSGKLRIVYE